MLNSDVEGRVASGGSSVLDGTAVGTALQSLSCLPVTSPAPIALVVQKYLHKNGGGMWGGNAYYGSSSSVLTSQSYGSGCFAYLNATVFNWTQIFDYLTSLSDILARGPNFTPTGSVLYDSGSKTVTLIGQSSTNVEVFDVNSAQIPTGGTVNWAINVPPQVDTIIINVNGSTVNFNSAMATSMVNADSEIVWNFFQATTINLNGQFVGALLAPYATVNAPDGQLTGQVFVNNWNGPMEIHYVKFNGCLPFINAPGASPYCVSS